MILSAGTCVLARDTGIRNEALTREGRMCGVY